MYLRVIYWYFYAVTNIPFLKSLADPSYPETSSLKKKHPEDQSLNNDTLCLKWTIYNVNSKTNHIHLAREQRQYYVIYFPMQIPSHKCSQVFKKI